MLLLQGQLDGGHVALGIRNSGTEAKTNISLRLAPELRTLQADATKLIESLSSLLQDALLP